MTQAVSQLDMSKKQVKVKTLDQISAGGVTFRRHGSDFDVAIVSVKPSLRWQLPKGIVDPDETPEITAVREVKEEAGIETDLLPLIETVEYWYQSVKYGKPIHYHKFVQFYLLQHRSGKVSDHDHEVAEAHWVSFDEAVERLAFKSERQVVEKALEMIRSLEKQWL